jgi:hypothetical protein
MLDPPNAGLELMTFLNVPAAQSWATNLPLSMTSRRLKTWLNARDASLEYS